MPPIRLRDSKACSATYNSKRSCNTYIIQFLLQFVTFSLQVCNRCDLLMNGPDPYDPTSPGSPASSDMLGTKNYALKK